MALARLLVLALLILAATGLHSAPLAQPRIVQTSCDTLGTTPPLSAIDFEVVNASLGFICEFRLHPIPFESEQAESCRVLECEAPPEWICALAPSPDNHTGWLTESEEGLLEPGETGGPFAIVVDPFVCCYRVFFFACGTMEESFTQDICLECDKPVQTSGSSWGRMKSLYR